MSEHSETIQIFFIVFSTLLMLILFLSKVLHDAPRLNRYLSEPAMTLLVGMVFGFLVSIAFIIRDSSGTSYYNNNNNNNNNQNVAQEVEQDLADSIVSFQTKVFFLALLPPILFNSGYQLQRELFMRHFAPISLFACLGTVISGLVAGGLLIAVREMGLFGHYFQPTIMELLTFGALIAATDTVSVVGILQAKQVDPHLFSLVFGESALNDAVSLVLFKTLSIFMIEGAFGDANNLGTAAFKFVCHLLVQATCSPILGMFYCVLMAIALRKVDLREHPLLELSVYMMPMYIPYMLSEALELSGMITIFFTGMFAKRYIEPNVSESTKQHSEMLFKLFAFLAETCIFLELGLSVFGLSGKFQWQFIGWAILAALVGRAASIYPLAACYNLSLTKVVMVMTACGGDGDDVVDDDIAAGSGSSDGSVSTTSSWSSRRETPQRRLDKRISLNFMHMLTFAGLRGAVAYACARDFPNLYGNRDSFVTTTMAIVLFTVIIMGGATQPLLERLKIRTGVDEKEYMRNWHAQRKLKGRFHRFEYHFIYRLAIREPYNPDPSYVAEQGAIQLCMTTTRDNTTKRNTTQDGAFDYQGMVDEDDEDDPQLWNNHADSLAAYYAEASAPDDLLYPRMSGIIQYSNSMSETSGHDDIVHPPMHESIPYNNSMPFPDDEYMTDESNVQNREAYLQCPGHKPCDTQLEDDELSLERPRSHSLGDQHIV